MTLPILRRFSTTDAGTVNTPQFAEDDETEEKSFLISDNNILLDAVNDPDPATGARYTISIFKAGDQTPTRIYSSGISPSTAGRVAVGPINMSPGKYQVSVKQTAGTAATYSCVLKFDHPFEG